jgi:hypothetical protein
MVHRNSRRAALFGVGLALAAGILGVQTPAAADHDRYDDRYRYSDRYDRYDRYGGYGGYGSYGRSYGYGYSRFPHRKDRDGDGVRNKHDWDKDGDGLRNRNDPNPKRPNRRGWW